MSYLVLGAAPCAACDNASVPVVEVDGRRQVKKHWRWSDGQECERSCAPVAKPLLGLAEAELDELEQLLAPELLTLFMDALTAENERRKAGQ